ncbi:hypothetical protein M2M17_000449 [Staphylococcus pseudintermedius]|nr:hypothetical protein [Staphylococcus pseudintermedius]
MKSNEITLEIELPYDFRIIRRGDSDNLELESLEYDFDIKERKKKNTKSWKFRGFYASVQAATRGYVKECPKRRMKGKVSLNDVVSMLKEVERIADKVSWSNMR